MKYEKRIELLRRMEREVLSAPPTQAAKLAKKITKYRGQIFDERYGIRFSLVPALLRLPQGIVIQIFVLCNLGFQRDILPNVEAVSVKKERIQR